jgi:hypothetical protein
MRNVLFRGRMGRRLFARYGNLPKLAGRPPSRVDERMVRTAGICLACVYVACLVFSALAIA